MASALDRHVVLSIGGDPGAQLQRRPRLTRPGDVVQLAFDGEERRPGDRFGRHALVTDVPEAARQQVLLKDDADAIQVVLRRQVADGVVLVVEAPVLRGVVEIALDEVAIEVPVRADVSDRIHGHEAGVLEESWIDPAAPSRVGRRHPIDEIGLEPAQRPLGGEVVDLVGLQRESIGPPINVKLRGTGSPADDIRAAAASTGTAG